MVDRARARAGPVGTGGLIRPMLAAAGPVPTGPGWAFEIKFDGVRAISYTAPVGTRLYSRNDRDVSRSYPEVAGLDLLDGLVLDGELVALDERGRPDFGLLQHRMHVAKPSPELIARVPVQYVVFDLLAFDGRPLLELPYGDRRRLLTELQLERPGVTVPANFTDTPGALVMAAAQQQGLEGVVAKRLSSPYRAGRRSRSWVKTPIRHTTEVIIAGWAPSSGNANVVGALLLAAHDADGLLVYVGDVGTGFTDATRRQLLELLGPLHRDTRPFPGAFSRARGWPGRAPSRGQVHWVEPELVGELEYRAFTVDATFRHPSWRGLRPDRDPADIGLPPPG
ncbi:non-homologous end-joining DNA ligase [Pseudonocardia sp. GCM10023141]|uniref:non-homologous end-joining DNA ligase n=1 Tax=Pseudonocardia sp. GCM10023141 TaxID=3252653 RepID=UPI0036109FFD